MAKLSKRFEKFLKEFPEIAGAYENFGSVYNSHLNKKTKIPIKLAISAGARIEDTNHARVYKASKAKIKKENIEFTIIDTLQLVFPATITKLS
ncbi:carboxymuconolactone decarboxylase family protein [Rosettibacter firmus]|uniref:carboxymuconolactone decarboxylase family protein n=1 Tax=Rosettibacter firmus TaxID=3111522 RepID=UPI00336BC118